MSELSRSPLVDLVVHGAIASDFPTVVPPLGNRWYGHHTRVIDGNEGICCPVTGTPSFGGEICENPDRH